LFNDEIKFSNNFITKTIFIYKYFFKEINKKSFTLSIFIHYNLKMIINLNRKDIFYLFLLKKNLSYYLNNDFKL